MSGSPYGYMALGTNIINQVVHNERIYKLGETAQKHNNRMEFEVGLQNSSFDRLSTSLCGSSYQQESQNFTSQAPASMI